MKCFVIMPFAKEFDDVYTMIKLHTEAVAAAGELSCGRLDEQRPAGRITDRLLSALRECSFCIADLTGCSANVMWEVGYAMALGKPLIVVTQNLSSLPFDVKDMQALGYDRNQLRTTLGLPLREIVRDTITFARSLRSEPPATAQEDQARLVTGLGVQLAEVKEMVGQIVQAWGGKPSQPERSGQLPRELQLLEGAWVNKESDTHIYIFSVEGRLVAPYCFRGDDHLMAHYYDWQMLGHYFFARFKWLSREISGFALLRSTSRDELQGAWWFDEDTDAPTHHLGESGKAVIWKRMRKKNTPPWASEFAQRVREGKSVDQRDRA